VRADAFVRRHVLLVVAALVGLVGVMGIAGPAYADPTDDEGGSTSLREQLDAASRGYLDAQTKLDASKARQQELTAQLSTVEQNVASQTDAVQQIAAAAYRSGRISELASVFASSSPDTFVDRLTMLNVMAANREDVVNDLVATRESVKQAKAAIDAEVVTQQASVLDMTKRKEQAEKALRTTGGGQSTTGFSGTSSSAAPAPRNANGSWPAESCSVDDPTTTGCITPRTLHALNQARAAGFTRYASCKRTGGGGEHPLGRACDFASAVSGFAGVATGDERTYGNNLAAYFVNNANPLGVLYVIWFRQIWMPGSGWRAYSGSGDPAAEHTNHVHLSVY
jgi:hypothetical protein